MHTRAPVDFCSITILGDRIRLVPISSEYSEIIFREFTDEITRYMMPATPSNVAEIHAFIQSSLNNMRDGTELILAIVQTESDEFLGVCGLHGQTNPSEPALGIWLKKSAHGHKYGQEAVSALVDWARQNIVFSHLIYPCDKANIPSRKIAEILGGVIVRTRDVRSMSGHILNEITYRII